MQITTFAITFIWILSIIIRPKLNIDKWRLHNTFPSLQVSPHKIQMRLPNPLFLKCSFNCPVSNTKRIDWKTSYNFFLSKTKLTKMFHSVKCNAQLNKTLTTNLTTSPFQTRCDFIQHVWLGLDIARDCQLISILYFRQENEQLQNWPATNGKLIY